MNFKKSYKPQIGYTKLCEIGKCSLKMLEFGMIELMKDDQVTIETGEKEYAFIFLGGHADIAVDEILWKAVGGRSSVFGGKAHSVYIPRRKKVTVTGCDHVKIAVCDTPVDEDSQPQLLPPDHVEVKKLGVKPWERNTHFIIDDRSNAKRLCIGEGFNTPGNWSGFPPHKHDEDRMPEEAVLEEIYYFQYYPETGFGIQCTYTKDGEFDEAYRVKQDDLVEFPRGYHATVGAPGYSAYCLWLMAGEHQGFYRTIDPDHEWVSAVETIIKSN